MWCCYWREKYYRQSPERKREKEAGLVAPSRICIKERSGLSRRRFLGVISPAGRPGGEDRSARPIARRQEPASQPHKSIHPLPLPAGRQPLEAQTTRHPPRIEPDPSSRLVSALGTPAAMAVSPLSSSLAFHGISQSWMLRFRRFI